MTRYEYIRVDLNDAPRGDAVALLNAVGHQGWELITLFPSHIAFMRREIVPDPEPSAKVGTRKRAKSAG